MITSFNNAAKMRCLLSGSAVMIFLSCTALLAQVPRGCTPSAMGTQFADVTGEHKAAAIAINLSGITVRRPGEKHFERREEWSNGPYFGTDVSSHQNIYFADVDGDGKADAIVSNPTGIAVSLSDGTQFQRYDPWTREPFFGSVSNRINNYFADVTGDGKADAIVVNQSGITVRRSNGRRFEGNETWTREPFIGGLGNYFADVTGDGKADAIVVNTNGITVRPSDGERFLRNEQWTNEPLYGNATLYFADVNGDGKADAIIVHSNGITVRLSDGRRFLPGRTWVRHAYYGAIATAFVDVDGDGKADAVVVNPDEIAIRFSDGERFVDTESWARNPYYGNLAPVCR